MLLTDLVVGLAIAIGLVGVLLPVLPGSVLIMGAVLVWAAVVRHDRMGGVRARHGRAGRRRGGEVRRARPAAAGGRRARRTLLAGAVLGVVGFFVVPVVGLVLGFVLGVYLSELDRVGRELAWPTTRSALRAVGLSILIELAAGVLAALIWLVGAVIV